MKASKLDVLGVPKKRARMRHRFQSVIGSGSCKSFSRARDDELSVFDSSEAEYPVCQTL